MKGLKTIKKGIVMLLLMQIALFTQCELTEKAKSASWKLVDTEIWWGPPVNGSTNQVKIESVPFDKVYTRTFENSGITSYLETTFSGSEFNLTRSEKLNGVSQGTITYTWSAFPAYIDPGVEFSCSVESKGTLQNGIGVSNYATALDGWPGGAGVWTQSFKNGSKTAKLTIDKPKDVSVASRMKFIVELSSGSGYGSITYRYIYEWIP